MGTEVTSTRFALPVRTPIRPVLVCALTMAALGGLASPSTAQTQFSVNYRGATMSVPDTARGTPITEGDILAPSAPGYVPGWGLPPPTIVLSGGFGLPPPAGGLGLTAHAAAVGHAPAAPGFVEVDALSYGMDYPIPAMTLPAGTFVFSVDPCAVGMPGTPLAPDVTGEGPVNDAAADVFQDLGMQPLPMPPPGILIGNTGIVDGDAQPSGTGYVYVGTGLVEPTLPGAGATGDDVDAIDFDSPTVLPVYFSLDGGFFNPCFGVNNTGSAFVQGLPPAAVLVTPAVGAAPLIWAVPQQLGLDLFGPETDDLDALALFENGSGVFEPSMTPFDWFSGGHDMLLFSVRQGSAVIGAPDSMFGQPIEPGDVLTTPLAGGLSPYPAIFVPAEALGLTTGRTGGVLSELDGLDTRFPPQTGTAYCFGDGSGTPCPCANFGAPGQGCASTAVPSGAVLSATGLPSVLGDTVTLQASGMPPGKLSLYFQGTVRQGGGFGVAKNDGIDCAGGPGSKRLGAMTTTAGGTSFYPNGALGHLPVSVRGAIPAVGTTRHYTVWYRDGPSICGIVTRVNYTNGYSIVWTP